MSEDRREDGFDPVLAIPLGSSFGMLGGVVLGIILLDNVGLGISAGMVIGTVLGTVVYALLQDPEDS